MDTDFPAMPPKVKPFADVDSLIQKLDGRASMWRRAAAEHVARAEEFEQAIQQLREGATSVTVGRTTYTVDDLSDSEHTQR